MSDEINLSYQNDTTPTNSATIESFLHQCHLGELMHVLCGKILPKARNFFFNSEVNEHERSAHNP